MIARPQLLSTKLNKMSNHKEHAIQIWVDADACPKAIKEILFRAAERLRVPLVLVANQPLKIPSSQVIKAIQVASGFDIADQYIVQNMGAGDLIITADIPLAAEVIKRDGFALNPRGELYTEENIRERLSMRNFMDGLRNSGMLTGGPAGFNQSHRQAFSNQLDKLLTKLLS